MNPIVSIIIPVFNRQDLVKDALDSVLAQSYQNWECIVVDDGSTDETWKVLEEYAQKDKRIKIHKRNREPKGAPTCRNIGINQSSGKYLMFLDSDDVLASECIMFRVTHAKKHPNYSTWIFDTSIFQKQIDDDDRMWNKLNSNEEDLIRFLKNDPPWSISGPLWKNTNMRLFDETALGGQDWEYHTRFLLKNKEYLKIENSPRETQIYCRRNPDRYTVSTGPKSSAEMILISTLNKNVIKDVFRFSKDKHVHKEAVYFLLRNSITQKKLELYEEAMKTWEVSKLSFSIRKREYYFWKIYISLHNKLTVKGLEFFVYRIIKKGKIFNRSSTLLNWKYTSNI